MWQWMKHGSTTSLQSQIGSQLSGQEQVKAVQSEERRKHQQARFWSLYFGMRKVFCLSITLRKEEQSIANIYIHNKRLRQTFEAAAISLCNSLNTCLAFKIFLLT